MKKIIALLLMLCLLFSLAACGKKETTSDKTDTVSKEETVESSSTQTEDEVSSEEDTSSTEEETESKEESSKPVSSSKPTQSKEESTGSSSKPTSSTTTSTSSVTKPTNSSAVSSSTESKKEEKPVSSSKPTSSTTPSNTESHKHSYSKATCTEAAKCSCGATQGAALGHKWTAATCTTKKTCSVCKATEGDVAGHKYVNHKCTVCQANESGYKTVESSDKTFSVILPEALANKCTIEAYGEWDGIQICVKDAALGMYAENVPVFLFTSVHNTVTSYEEDWKKKGDGLVFDPSSFNTLEGMGFKLKKTSHTNEEGFTIYCQYIGDVSKVTGNSAVVKELLNNESKIEIVFN